MKIIYAKYNRERLPEFQVSTQITDKGDKIFVSKKPLTNEAKSHICSIYNNYLRLKEDLVGCKLAEAKFNDEEIKFEYIEGNSFDKMLYHSVAEKNKEIFLKTLDDYMRLIFQMSSLYEDDNSIFLNEEIEFFSDKFKISGYKCTRYANLDLNFDNIIIDMNSNVKIIDYEWIVSYITPILFIAYRSIKIFYYKYSEHFDKFLQLEEIYSHCGISKNDLDLFERMEKSFQETVYGKKRTYIINDRYEQEHAHLSIISKYVDSRGVSKLYIDYGQGYSEEDSTAKYVKNISGEELLIYKMKNCDAKKVINFRWTPIYDYFCRVSALEIKYIDKNGKVHNLDGRHIVTNGNQEEDTICFDILEPTFIFKDLNLVISELIISYKINILTNHEIEKKYIQDNINEVNSLNRTIADNNETMDRYCNEIKRYQSIIEEYKIKDEKNKIIINKYKAEDEKNKKVLQNHEEELECRKKALIEYKKELNEKQFIINQFSNNQIDLEATVENLQSQNEFANRQLDELLNSTSWKITAPFRKLGFYARKVKDKVKKISKYVTSRRQLEDSNVTNIKGNRIILVMSHTDYLNSLGGTEKYIFEQSNEFKKQGYNVVQLFPRDRKYFLGTDKAFYGVNVNEEFKGFYTIEEINKIVISILPRIKKAYIHHLIYWQYGDIDTLLDKLYENSIYTMFYMHDFFACCPSVYWIYMGKAIPAKCFIMNNEKDMANFCLECDYHKDLSSWVQKFASIFDKVNDIVTPSEFVMQKSKVRFMQYIDKFRVQGHLKLEGERKKMKYQNNEKIRLAFLGYKSNVKGWSTWENIFKSPELNKKYKFYHLGSPTEYADNITCQSYSFIDGGPMAAVNLLGNNQIDLVLLWSNLPESYSYTLYESIAAGAYVLTSCRSGNIAEVILNSNEKLGKVFNSEEELIKFLNSEQEIKTVINREQKMYDLTFNKENLK